MALINCPECGKELSIYAEKCPNCGFPLAKKLWIDFEDYYCDWNQQYFLKFYPDGLILLRSKYAVDLQLDEECEDSYYINSSLDKVHDRMLKENDSRFRFYGTWKIKESGIEFDFDSDDSDIWIIGQSKHRIYLGIRYSTVYKIIEIHEHNLISNKELEAFRNRIEDHEGELFTTFSNDQFYYQAIDSVYRTDGMMADLIVYPMGKNPLLIPTDYLKKCFAFNLKDYSSIENGEVYDVGSEECIDISLNAELVPYVVSLLNDPRISWV